MPTESITLRRPPASLPARLGVAVASLATLTASPAAAQAPLFLVDAETRVRSVAFEVTGQGVVPTSRMREHVSTTGPGAFAGLRGAFDFLPGVSEPIHPRFSPLSLQKDVVRLRLLHRDAGLPDATVDYRVVLDTATNRVDVTFAVEEGEPIRLGSVRATASEEEGAWPPDVLAGDWTRYMDAFERERGRRYSLEERTRIENRTSAWLRDRGYPWGHAEIATADTVDGSVDVGLMVRPGMRARVDTVVIEGHERLSRRAVRREVPIERGDWYSGAAVASGEREIYELELVRRALGDLPDDQPRDSSVAVRYRIDEGLPRLIWGRMGYRTRAGVSGEVHWAHRNFLGDGRSLTASAVGESGWGALEAVRSRRVGLSLALRQPFLWHRRLSLTLAPFGRFRDDFRDRSVEFGFETSLLYEASAFKHLGVQHEVARRRVNKVLRLAPVRERVESGDSVFAPVFVTHAFELVGSYGRLDDRLRPRRGYLVRPSVQVAGPAGLSDVEYLRFAVEALGVTPLGAHAGLFGRVTAGRLFPQGASDPRVGEDRTRSIAGLRGVMFTAGGVGDVRGWSRELLGPKMPDLSVGAEGEVSADRWVPVGGLARLTGHAELILPFPLLSDRHSTHLFTDAGRVWSPGSRFDAKDPELVTEGWMYSVGAGFEISSLFGPIRLSVGYKLNPTRIDLLSPGGVAGALATGTPLSELETRSLRRWSLHLSIGRSL